MNAMRGFIQAQPARMLYPYRRGWRILAYGSRALLLHCRNDLGNRWSQTEALIDDAKTLHWFKRFWLYIWIMCELFYNVVFSLALVLFEIIAVGVFVLALVVIAAICSCIIVLFIVYVSINAKIKAQFCCCPNCHRSMPIPLYFCPVCRREHTRLMPNHYGILNHYCGCGTRLPTLDTLGRKDLSRYCPYCRTPLHRGIGKGSNVHIPLVGGPSVGKTNYMIMSIQELRQALKTVYDISVSFPDPTHQHIFQQGLHLLARGRVLPMTSDQIPSAFNMLFKAPRLLFQEKLLYLYDVQGEAFGSMERLSRQEYYKYTKGIIFMIDLFSIPKYYDEHRREIEAVRTSLRPATLGVEETYDRMIEMLDSTVGFRNRFSIPVAVVVNKVDALNLEDEIGEVAAQTYMQQHPSISRDEAMTTVVREFLLKYGLENFVHNLEARFTYRRYFSCSALGRLPSPIDTSPFVPVRVLEPLVWLLTSARAFKGKQ
jgi:hypothetical protein